MFCCGGIGATPDDVTRYAAADASGRPLAHHPEGMEILRERFPDGLSEYRMRMVEFPDSASLIPNPVNRITRTGLARRPPVSPSASTRARAT